MNKDTFTLFLKQFVLNQRELNYDLKKTSDLNRTYMEVLMYANNNVCFNAYNVQKHYVHINLQQIRLGIRKLQEIKAIELIGHGVKGKPATFIITTKGKMIIDSYIQQWYSKLCL